MPVITNAQPLTKKPHGRLCGFFVFQPQLTPPCHCPSRLPNEPPSSATADFESQAAPKPGKRSTRARAEPRTAEPADLLDARLVAGATPRSQRTAAR